MKSPKYGIIPAGLLLLASAAHTFGIEGLTLSLQCSNVVLSWPSTPGENYIVQYRPTLDPSTPWETLTSSWAADPTTNITYFVHSNIVQNPNCGGEGLDMMAEQREVPEVASEPLAIPMVMPANGEGIAVPLIIYPPGFNLSGFLIFDPSTGEWVSGKGYKVKSQGTDGASPDVPDPGGDGGGDGGGATNAPAPAPGFYEVVQDGVRISNGSMEALTNGVVSNSIDIAFEAGNAANDGTGTNVAGNLDSAMLVIDGAEYAGDGVIEWPRQTSPWTLNFDSAYLQNGSHTLQIEVSWKNPDSTDNNYQYFTRYSDPVSIVVSNQISYPNWEPEVGELGISAYFLQTVFTNVPWTIDIYDVNSNLVQTLTNITTDGSISAYWNMVDNNGVTRTNADLDPKFDAIVTVYDAPTTKHTPKKKQRKNNWPAHGVWTVAYQDFFKFEYSANNLMQGTLNSYANTAAKYGGYYLYYPPAGQTNDIGQTYPMRYQKTNHFDASITPAALALDTQLLESFLSNSNSRNFFFDGHGNGSSFAGIASGALQGMIKQRYRFVMIDACSSATGDVDKAFGINGPGTFAGTYYESTGIRPAGYCGYSRDVFYAVGGPVNHNGVTYDDTIPDDVPYFISNFLFYWDLENQGLQEAIDDGGQNLSPVDGQYREDYWKIFGYNELGIDQVNHGTDTW
jgi:hypothetical protein